MHHHHSYERLLHVMTSMEKVKLRHIVSLLGSIVSSTVIGSGFSRVQKAVEERVWPKRMDTWQAGVAVMLLGLLMMTLFLWAFDKL